jgi:AcrR family transcriptional regulator
MRYSTDHKQATRHRILEAAGRRFKKQDGIDGTGVAAVMSDAGLTNGAFYAHFMSKEDLVANVLADQLRAQRQTFDAQPPRRAAVGAAPAGRTGEGACGAVQVLGSPLVESTTIILISGKSCS